MINRKLIHRFFDISILLKGLFAFLELIFGLLLFFVTSDLLLKSVYYIFGHELMQDPADIFVNFLLSLFSNFSVNLRIFFAIYLLAHGIIKLGLIISLWKKKLWAYPVSEAVFLLFAFYQIYRYVDTNSFFLIILTIIDFLVIISIQLEYQTLKRTAR